MTNLYIVFKEGVYRQGCGGVFSSFDLARDAAYCFISGEPDDYHSYEVIEVVLDEKSQQTPVVKHETTNIHGIVHEYLSGGCLIDAGRVVLKLVRGNGEFIEEINEYNEK